MHTLDENNIITNYHYGSYVTNNKQEFVLSINYFVVNIIEYSYMNMKNI